MLTPFEILGVAETATDEEINQAYLKNIKENPPERDTERFETIREAYQRIATSALRCEYRLFHAERADIDGLLGLALAETGSGRPSTAVLSAALLESTLADLKPPESME